ncbi:hypothetical protein HDV01_007370 [Terramyces sp. JEL0728]|nr:hypothetical protein HDV01_007370 [Terramyces sp. JEL0728]
MLNNSLPPLPVSQKGAVPPGEENITFPAIEDEDVYQNHLLRVQETILASTDAQLEEFASKFNETQVLLKRTMDEKANTGIELYRSRKELGILNKQRSIVEKSSAEQTILKQEIQSSEKTIQEYEREVYNLQQENRETKRQLDASQTNLLQMQEITGNYTSEVKIQKRISTKLQKEMSIAEQKYKESENKLIEERERNEILFNARKAAEGAFAQQQSEVRAAQHTINILHKEVREVNAAKQAIEKQWEEALSAMSNRDKSIQQMANTLEKRKTVLIEAQNVNKVYKKETSELSSNLAKKEQEIEELKRQAANSQSSLESTQHNYNETNLALNQAKQIQDMLNKELDVYKKLDRKKDDDIERGVETVASLKSKIDRMQVEFEEKLRFYIPVEKAFKQEEAVQIDARKRIKDILHDEDAKNLDLRHENAKLKIALSAKEDDFKILQNTHNSLKDQNDEINEQYSRLTEEAKQMVYALERKEHDLNLFRAKAAEKEDDYKETFHLAIAELRDDLKSCNIEKDRLQTLWLQSQKELVSEQARFQKLKSENELLTTKLGISECVKIKTDKGLNEIKVESHEHKLETAKLYNELKRLRPVIAELQEKNKKLEHQLQEAQLKLDESVQNNVTTKQMLRNEIRRLSQDRSILRQERSEHDRTLLHVEKDVIVYKEMIDKLKSERYDLQREVFTLKRRTEETERKFYDYKLKTRKVEKIDQKKSSVENIEKQFLKLGQVKASMESLNSEGRQSVVPKKEKIVKELPDFDSWRLRIDSLTNEKKFLVNENSTLKDQLAEITAKVSSIQISLKQTQEENKKLVDVENQNIEKLKTLDLRYARAKKVAAHMEKQVKDAKPNIKIDYQLLETSEPSTQLLAAILAKMDKMRVFVAEKNEHVMGERHIIERVKRLAKIDRYARNNHHLLGTKNVPGVPLMNNYLPEILKNNSGIQECIAKIGKNPRKIIIKQKEIVPHSPKDLEKKSQGPFLVNLTYTASLQVESGIEETV